jgi:hypothetical protein
VFNLYKVGLVISWFSIILVLRPRHWHFPVLLILMTQPIFFFKRVYSCAVVDACLMWTDLIILISRPVRWDKLDQSTHFKGKLHKLPINVIIWLQIMSFSDWLTSLVTIFDSNKVNKWNYYTSHNKESIILVKYRILGILFMGLTLSRGISGEPERRLTWYTPW